VRKRKQKPRRKAAPGVPLSARRNLVIFSSGSPSPQKRPTHGRPRTRLLVKLIRAAAAEECKDKRYKRNEGGGRYQSAVAVLRNRDFCGLEVPPVDARQIKRDHLDVKRLGVAMDLATILEKLPLLMRAKTEDDVLALLKPNPSGLYFSYDE